MELVHSKYPGIETLSEKLYNIEPNQTIKDSFHGYVTHF